MENELVVSVEKNKDSKLNNVLFSLLTLILGIFLIIATDDILITSNYVFVCIFTFIGVLQFINFLLNKNDLVLKREKLTISLVFLWLAMVMYQYYYNMVILLPILFSLYLLITGSNLVIKFIAVKREIGADNYVHLVLGLVTIIIGILLIFEPVWVVYTYFKIAGVNIILISLLSLFDIIKGIRVNKNNG